MAFGIGDELSVRISAQTSDFEEGINDAQSEALQLSGTLQVLQGRADEAGDELGSAGRKASTASSGFAALSASAGGANVGFATLSTTTTASLTPALAALSTTLAPLAATFGTVGAAATGLAGAFGLVVGSGLIAFGQKRGKQNAKRLEEIRSQIRALEQLQEGTGNLTAAQERQLQKLREQEEKLEDATGVMGGLKSAMDELGKELKPIIVQFGQQFVPLIEDALDALPQLVKNIIDAAGNMDPFVQALRDFGQAAFEILPQITAELTDLARESLPLLRQFFGFIRREGPGAFEAMIQTTREVGPSLIRFTQALIDALPALLEFGTVILNRVTPALETIVTVANAVMSAFNRLPTAAQGPVAAFTLLLPVITSVGGAIASLAASVGGATGGLSGLGAALVGITGPIGLVVAAVTGLTVLYSKHTQAINSLISQGIARLESALTRVANWIRENAPALIGRGFELIGEIIRGFLIEFYNIIASPKDSILLSAYIDAAKWIIANGPTLFVKGWELVFDMIWAALEGFYKGLIGNSFFPELFNDIAAFIKNKGARMLSNAFETVIEELIDLAKAAGKGFVQALANGIRQADEIAINAVENLAADMRKRLTGSDAKIGPLSDVTAAGRGLPQAYATGIRQAKPVAVSAVRSLAEQIEVELQRIDFNKPRTKLDKFQSRLKEFNVPQKAKDAFKVLSFVRGVTISRKEGLTKREASRGFTRQLNQSEFQDFVEESREAAGAIEATAQGVFGQFPIGATPQATTQQAQEFARTQKVDVTVNHKLPEGESVLEQFIRETTRIEVEKEFDQRSRRLDRLRERGGR